jgi:hypothetical protein
VKDGDLATPMELGDFLQQVGVVMRLPARRATPKAPSAVETKRAVTRRTAVALPVSAVLALAAFAVVELRPAPPPQVPASIVGTWETMDRRYAGRQFIVSADSLTQLVPGASRESAAIRAVALRALGDTLAITLTAGDQKPYQEVSLTWLPAPHEHLILKNPAAVAWVRAGTVPR